MKILFISNTPPVPSWGGAMTFYRHFCERNDFEISVITDDPQINKYDVPYSYLLIKKGKIWSRISRTRFYLLPHTWSLLVGTIGIPDEVMRHAKSFNPDAIYTVGGTWTWMALIAKKVAKKLNVPLIGSFNDWWFYNTIYHPKASKFIENKFREFYRDCDLALCTSEGMQKALGPHKNSVILYPTGSAIQNFDKPSLKANENFTVAFAGNLGDWYGKMLEALVKASKGSGINFKFFGSNASWSAEFDEYVKKEKIYRGQIAFKELQEEMQKVDGLLLLMGFDESCAIIETTSFKTKFLDYLTFHKPILLWGPSYCSAVAVATEFSSAEICTSASADDFVKSIIKVKNDTKLQNELVANSYRMYEERFNPERLHEILKSKIKGLLTSI